MILFSKYEENHSADYVDVGNLSFSAPETLCEQNAVPSQPLRIDAGKVGSLLRSLVFSNLLSISHDMLILLSQG